MVGQGSSPMQEDPKGAPAPNSTNPAASAAGSAQGASVQPAQSAADEIAMLDRLLTRLALTEEGKLEKVLEKLLPLAVSKMGSPHDGSRKKVTVWPRKKMEMRSPASNGSRGLASVAGVHVFFCTWYSSRPWCR